MTLKAVFLDYQSLSPNDLSLGELWNLPVEWVQHEYTNAEDTADRVSGFDIILTNKVVINTKTLRSNPSCKLIIILATGTNNVDLQTAKALNIPVCNIVAYSTEAVVQQTFSLLLALHSRLLDYDASVKKGDWCRSQFFGLLDHQIQEVYGKTIGIIGYGAIGKRVAEVAAAFGMKVMIAESFITSPENNNSDVTRHSLKEVYAQADVISVHCPLSEHSNNFIDAAAFKRMKDTAILLNMGRGGIVNEADLSKALKENHIKAAATDVLTQEPPEPNHVLLDATIPNLIVTPHVAWASVQARQALIGQVVEIIEALLNGSLVNQVNI